MPGDKPGVRQGSTMAVEMYVHRVLIDFQGNALIVLADEEAERRLQIWIGMFEAQAIARVLKSEEPPRPLTHDLCSSVIAILGYELRGVMITKLEENTFFALLTLVDSDRTIDIDARPSDAIALALRSGAPILVDEEVLAQAAQSDSQIYKETEEIKKFRDLISEIDVPDSDSFRVPPHDSEEDTEDE